MDLDLAGRRIALVGGAGFVGHHLALRLRQLGADVLVVDSLQVNNLLHFASRNGNESLFNERATQIIHQRLDLLRQAEIPLRAMDARDYHGLSHEMAKFDPDTIVHLAAVAHAGKANKDPYTTFGHSTRTLENSLDYARGNVEHFVYFSSSMAYGDFKTPQVDETHPLEPIGIYGALKAAGERFVVAYNQVFDLPFTTIRPSALYGPRCVSRRVTQMFIENALSGQTLRVDGDGKDRLDFTYIDDLVSGVCLAISKPATNDVYNMTYGSARSINDLVEILREHIPDLEVEYVERDRLMPHRGTLNVDKARRILGYEPKYPLQDGYPEYIRWYQNARLPFPVAKRTAPA